MNSIKVSVSKALSDKVISHEEFIEVKDEEEGYNKQKELIRGKKKRLQQS